MTSAFRPLVLGASGRIGRAFRALAASGLWPGPVPVWQMRRATAGPGTLGWDLTGEEAPRHLDPLGDAPLRGVIVLAGPTAGTEAELAANSTLARIALDLSAARGLGPVLLMSTAAVYGRRQDLLREADAPTPASPYGAAKAAMEQAAMARHAELGAAAPPCLILRLANVAGCGALFQSAAQGPVTLDRLPDGHGPRRSWIGPLTLARAFLSLIEGADLAETNAPVVLNLAQPGALAMDEILGAMGLTWTWRAPPPDVLPGSLPDLRRALALLRLPEADPVKLVAEARLAGWRAHGEGVP